MIDPAEQAAVANQADSLLWDDLATIPLWRLPAVVAFSNRVGRAKPNPTDQSITWNMETWDADVSSGSARWWLQNPSARGGSRGSMNDRDELVELMARYASIPDTDDWEALPLAVFTDPVCFDFESVTGVPPAELPLAKLLAGFPPGSPRSPRPTTPSPTTGSPSSADQADIRAHVRAEHWLRADPAAGDPACWLLVGFYDHHAVRNCDGWRLDRIALTVTHQSNAHLRERR